MCNISSYTQHYLCSKLQARESRAIYQLSGVIKMNISMLDQRLLNEAYRKANKKRTMSVFYCVFLLIVALAVIKKVGGL
jgi:hypothetical protein